MTTTNLKIGQSVIVTKNGKKFIAKIQDIFSCGTIGLITVFNPDVFLTKEINGNLYGSTVAFAHELKENRTGLTIR